MSLRRSVLLALLVVVAVLVGYSLWLAFQVRADLRDAEAAGEQYVTALKSGESDEATEALADLDAAAGRAGDRTGGSWWGVLTHAPLVGDDADGIRALSQSLSLIASEGVAPLADSMDRLPDLTADGRVDLDLVAEIAPQVEAALDVFTRAEGEVVDVDSSGFAGPVRGRFDRYVELVSDARRNLASAATATEVLPTMLGADGPRQYLLCFQNNAEIRATGGMPGSWALIDAQDGALSIRRQGDPVEFDRRPTPVLPLSTAERRVYGNTMGVFFQSSNFTPDFPRAAELWTARFEEEVPGSSLDGVIAIDPVGMSYLLAGTGPVQVDDRTLTADNAVDELLSRPYRELGPYAQNRFFAKAAREIFAATTDRPDDPVAFVRGLTRAVSEGRLLVSAEDPAVAERLAGSRTVGALAGDDGETPHVDIGMNDATASKMSYFLRYSADVRSVGCQDGRQSLRASMSLSQSIAASEAAKLPEAVTGDVSNFSRPGIQLVFVRLYGPYGGTIDDIRLVGKALRPPVVELDGRPVVTLIVQLESTRELPLTWTMQTGEGQTGDGKVGLTPSIVPGNNDGTFASSC